MNRKGVVLVVTLVVTAVLLVLTGTYFFGVVTEKRSADSERFVLQALGLAEAGASHAVAELRERIRTDLKNKIEVEKNSSVFNSYIINNDSLGFLRDFAYAAGDSQFVVSDNQARLSISPLALNTAVAGQYTAALIVTASVSPTKDPQADIYYFPYNYAVESQGRITKTTPAIQKTLKLVQGNFTVTVRRDTLAKFALFSSHHRTPSGTTVWFTANTNFTGPVSTNERFSFANNPSAHFTEEVTQHETKARFYNNGWPLLINADSNPPKDVPIFDKGFKRGEDIINLESSVSQADLKKEALGGMPEPDNGIYVPNNDVQVTGGIYIKGNQGSSSDNPIIAMSAGTNGPVYNIRRGTSGTPTVVTVDYTANGGVGSTTVQVGSNPPVTYQGIPDGLGNEGIIIYTNDDVGSLYGTAQQDTSITVSAERDIVITDPIQYQEFTSDNPDTPDENELSAEGYDNLLGILSWGGDVIIGTSAPNDIEIHGVVMAPHGVFTVDNYSWGSPRGTATLLGGAITDFYGPFGTFSGTKQISGYGRNFVYDARMLEGMVPPYFPYMTNFTSFDDGGLDNRLVWQDKGA